MQLKIRLFLAALAFLFAAACADALTGPNGAPRTAAGTTANSSAAVPENALGLTHHQCTFGIKDPRSREFRTRHTRVGFPVSELHPEGALREYVYRAYGGGEVVIVARCIIPATERARARMDRLFKVQTRHDHGPDGITTMSDDCCPPVTVIACRYGGTYPDCDSPPSPSNPDEDIDWCHDYGDCGDSGDWDWSGGDGGAPGGGGPGTTPTCDPSAGCDPDTACDPSKDPDCEKPLTDADTTTIKNALRNGVRAQSQFTDTTAARVCREMVTWFTTALSSNRVFRGKYDSNTALDPEHYGMYYSGNIHFDPAGLDAANAGDPNAVREVAITALHEAAHYAGHRHPTRPTFDGQGRDYYTDFPFNHLNPGPNSCVAR